MKHSDTQRVQPAIMLYLQVCYTKFITRNLGPHSRKQGFLASLLQRGNGIA